MPAVATGSRRGQEPKTWSADPTEKQVGEDGFEVRFEYVDGELTPFSLKPYPEAERPRYFCQHNGIEMRFRSRVMNELGFQPTIQKERWTDGEYRPRNAWEEHMTREYMKKTFKGCVDPDTWRISDHPKGEGHWWRCQCGYHSPNLDVFEQHQREYSHDRMQSE